MAEIDSSNDGNGSSPAGRGGAGVYIEGELGAFYLLSMLAGSEARGLPASRLTKVQFQAVEDGFALDDLVLHGASAEGPSLLEIQSKRTITFAPKDPVFEEVCHQIARSKETSSVPEARHGLAVATQRTSYRISGPYQDVIAWARSTDSASRFFGRLTAKGVASPEMRSFVETFRAKLVAAGVADDDEPIWHLLRRFQILEFDFESASPLARTHALSLARVVLAPADAGRADGLWSTLIEMSLAAGKGGGWYDLPSLRQALVGKGFQLAGERDFTQARAKLAEMAKHALANIDSTVAGAHLLRTEVVQAFDEARDKQRFVELRGKPGVGKSAFLKLAAERVSSQAHALVLDPIGTPEGGWSVLAAHLGVTSTAHEFLADLAMSGGGVLFIDSLEMFTSEGRRRTVNDILREVSVIDGFSVVVTARADFGKDGDDWLAADAVAALGPTSRVVVADLTEADVAVLRAHAPELRAILAPDHPAAAIARNLYRLTRLLKAPATASIRTEAALAAHWWATGSDAGPAAARPAQRILAALAEAALAGRQTLHTIDDGLARSGLLASLTLRETRRDHLAFYHDVLRDWAVGKRLTEAPELLDDLDLTRPVPQTVARGVEFAGRFFLEDGDGERWSRLLEKLSSGAAHGSWRRHALLAILRSEVSSDLLERETSLLLQHGGSLLIELSTAVSAVDTIPMADLLKDLGEAGTGALSAPNSLRTVTGLGGPRLLFWCITHAEQIPLQALPAVLKLVNVHLPMVSGIPALGRSVAEMLFGWLLQLDVRKTVSAIPNDAEKGGSTDATRRMIPDLRTLSLLLASQAPNLAKAYLFAVSEERDTYKVKAIRPFSASLSTVAPEELARLIESGLIDARNAARSSRSERSDPLGHGDTDYMPASPAQPPFLDLLEASKDVGLNLIRRLAAHVLAFDAAQSKPDDGFTLVFEDGTRFFPRRDSYFWSRDRSTENSVASGLKALEAWGHCRLEAGEPVEDVIADILGPDGSCAAFLLVAVDLLISHWPATRSAAVPFVSCPALLAADRGRISGDDGRSIGFALEPEPAGRVQLKDLQARPSRGVPLEQLLPWYSTSDEISKRTRAALAAVVDTLEPYEDWSNFADPRFMGVRALNVVTPENWIPVEGGRAYASPPAEAQHLARLEKKLVSFVQSVETEAKIDLATTKEDQASTELAREAVEYADGELPDGSDTDYLKTRSTRLVKTAMLVARDGDDELLASHEVWVRTVIDWALTEEVDGVSGSRQKLEYSRPALATCALAHLWRRLERAPDRNRLLSISVRKDGGGLAGFEAAIEALMAVDLRLAKSVLRAALLTARWRWNSYDEDPAITQAFLREDAAHRARVVDAETVWLEGGAEPPWPTFPPKPLALRRPLRLGQLSTEAEPSDTLDADAETEEDTDDIQFNADTAAQWLSIMVEAKLAAIETWLPEIVSAYAHWTARANGLGLNGAAEIERPPSRWNGVFYGLAASVLLNGPEGDFDAVLRDTEDLPDLSFAAIAAILIRAADVWYFNNVRHASDRVVELRRRFARRTLTMGLWNRSLRPASLSVDHDAGPLVATLLLNTHNPFTGTTSYLVPAVFDRIDPLLEPLRLLLEGGPVPFIALCVTNTLGVKPRARQAEFLISGVETWQTRVPTDTAMWLDLGIGRRVVEWLRSAAVESPELHGPQHPLRHRIDAVLGRLVAMGVAEAHELETTIQNRPGSSSKGGTS